MADPPAMKTRRALQAGGAVFCLGISASGCVPGRRLGGGEPGNGSDRPAATLVSGGTWASHHDASFRAGQLGVVAPIFGDGLLEPVELRSRTTPARHDAPDGGACRTSLFRSRPSQAKHQL